jgi:hypothetical protein
MRRVVTTALSRTYRLKREVQRSALRAASTAGELGHRPDDCKSLLARHGCRYRGSPAMSVRTLYSVLPAVT